MSLAPSSPRLPSPPPPAEIQIGPKSPLMGPNATRAQQIEQNACEASSKRRIHPGTKSADMAAGPPLVPLHELDSAFQLQEHLAALHYHHTASNTTPMTRETARTLASPPPGTDKILWLYELCRFLVGQCNSLLVGFLFDTPPCSAATCPEMRASEWQFLCAVHDAPKSCCAIDYCCHTLDWAANVVTNPKIFPSRFVVDAHDKNTALKNLVNVFRRLHRIFAHAWFQHRGVFWSVEGQTGLYVFFKTVCDVYDLLPAENYKLPPEAEGLEPAEPENTMERKIILQHHHVQQNQQQQQPAARQGREEDDGLAPVASRTNTRRHIKSSPSTGSAVTTVPEADEDEAAEVTSRLRGMHISNSATIAAADEEMELATIPVIVEHLPLEQPPPLRPGSVVPISGPGSIAAMRAAAPLDPDAPLFEDDVPPAVPEVPTAPEPKVGETELEVGDFQADLANEKGTSAPAPGAETKEAENLSPQSEPKSETAPEPENAKQEAEGGEPMIPPPTPVLENLSEDELRENEKAEVEAGGEVAKGSTEIGEAAAAVSAAIETASDGASEGIPTPPPSDGQPSGEDEKEDENKEAAVASPSAEATEDTAEQAPAAEGEKKEESETDKTDVAKAE
ncbi:hypothetical protein OQA88_12758 [Cercophora sp. LCS_1]